MSDKIEKEEILNVLRKVEDPELHKDLVSLDMVGDIKISQNNDVSIKIILTTPACPLKSTITKDIKSSLKNSIPSISNIEIDFDSKVQKGRSLPGKEEIPGVKNSIAVTSGKGGVGKTTVSVNIAVSLAKQGAKVGLCDCDIYGPNVPIMLGLAQKPMAQDKKIIPLEKFGMKVMSMGFFLDPETPVIWRGPMLHGVIRQFLYDVIWGELDYLVLDLPPGTGDAQLTIAQSLPLVGGMIVTTPQNVALQDALKGINMFKQLQTPILGLVENMSYFKCPGCGKITNIFGSDGGKKTAEQYNVSLLGQIPLGESIRIKGDEGVPIVIAEPESEISENFNKIASKVAASISIINSK